MSEFSKVSTTQLRHPLAIAKAKVAYGDHDETFEVLARYDIQGPIAKGTFGYVCAALDMAELVDDEDGRPVPKEVAIKKIGHLFDSERHWVCGARELQMLLDFRHKNVIGASDLFIPLGEHNHLTISSIAARKEHFEEVYIVMDRMAQTLRDFIDSQEAVETTDPCTGAKLTTHPCSLMHRCYFLFQLLIGMGYLHRCNVMHRDLKPENVLIDSNWVTKICDFGQGRGIGEGNNAITTQADCCTQWYAAPESLTLTHEHAETPATVDHSIFHAVDIWSIGCIAAEMLMGRPVFGEINRGGLPQLKRIVQTMGMPQPEDLKSIARSDDPKALEEMHLFIKQFGKVPEESLLSKLLVTPLGAEESSVEEVDLILKMLRYNPKQRITIEEALRHPLFANYFGESETVESLLGCPTVLPTLSKDQLQTADQARDMIWGLFLTRHPEVAELIEALGENERRDTLRKQQPQ